MNKENEKQLCKTCNGDGFIVVDRTTEGHPVDQDCEECNATGYVSAPVNVQGETDLWKEVAKLFTGIVSNTQWKEAIEKAKVLYTLKEK